MDYIITCILVHTYFFKLCFNVYATIKLLFITRFRLYITIYRPYPIIHIYWLLPLSSFNFEEVLVDNWLALSNKRCALLRVVLELFTRLSSVLFALLKSDFSFDAFSSVSCTSFIKTLASILTFSASWTFCRNPVCSSFNLPSIAATSSDTFLIFSWVLSVSVLTYTHVELRQILIYIIITHK